MGVKCEWEFIETFLSTLNWKEFKSLSTLICICVQVEMQTEDICSVSLFEYFKTWKSYKSFVGKSDLGIHVTSSFSLLLNDVVTVLRNRKMTN